VIHDHGTHRGRLTRREQKHGDLLLSRFGPLQPGIIAPHLADLAELVPEQCRVDADPEYRAAVHRRVAEREVPAGFQPAVPGGEAPGRLRRGAAVDGLDNARDRAGGAAALRPGSLPALSRALDLMAWWLKSAGV